MSARPGNPLIQCEARILPAVGADPATEFWQGIVPAGFGESLSGTEPQQATCVRLAWDWRELRVLFVAEDAMPWATLTERKAPLYTEEVVEAFLDPVGDLASYFELEVNPLNTLLDLVIRKNRSGYVKEMAWECEGFTSRVAVRDGSWITELSIPFAAVTSTMPTHGTRWRANFCRIDRPPGFPRELSAWSPTYRPTFHTPERFGVIEFVE